MKMLGSRVTLRGVGLWPSGFGPDRDDVATTGSSVSTVPRHSKQPPLSGRNTLTVVCLRWTWLFEKCYEISGMPMEIQEVSLNFAFFFRKNAKCRSDVVLMRISWGKPERSIRISNPDQDRAQQASMMCLQHTRRQRGHIFPRSSLSFDSTPHIAIEIACLCISSSCHHTPFVQWDSTFETCTHHIYTAVILQEFDITME